MNPQHRKLELTLPEPTQPLSHSNATFFLKSKKRKKGVFVFVVYLRFLSTSAAAMTAMMTTAAAIAMYVVVGIPLVGCGATLGEGEVEVCT